MQFLNDDVIVSLCHPLQQEARSRICDNWRWASQVGPFVSHVHRIFPKGFGIFTKIIKIFVFILVSSGFVLETLPFVVRLILILCNLDWKKWGLQFFRCYSGFFSDLLHELLMCSGSAHLIPPCTQGQTPVLMMGYGPSMAQSSYPKVTACLFESLPCSWNCAGRHRKPSVNGRCWCVALSVLVYLCNLCRVPSIASYY